MTRKTESESITQSVRDVEDEIASRLKSANPTHTQRQTAAIAQYFSLQTIHVECDGIDCFLTALCFCPPAMAHTPRRMDSCRDAQPERLGRRVDIATSANPHRAGKSVDAS